MTDRQLLEQEIAEYKDRAQQTQDHLARLQTKLDALPKERVRLRADINSNWPRVYAGSDLGNGYICSIFEDDCARHNIDPAALAAHICRFGEPDVTTAPDCLPQLEAVASAAQGYKERAADADWYVVSAALAALDAARNGGA